MQLPHHLIFQGRLIVHQNFLFESMDQPTQNMLSVSHDHLQPFEIAQQFTHLHRFVLQVAALFLDNYIQTLVIKFLVLELFYINNQSL
jgi:hypothetical protein